MKIRHWSAVVGVMVAVLGGVLTAPATFARASEPPLLPIGATGHDGVAMVSPGTAILAFNTSDPAHAQPAKKVGNLNGDRLIGIDYRPGNGKLYGVGLGGKIYTIDPKTAAATSVGKLSVEPNGPSEGKAFDIDFTPSGKELRIVSATGQNIRQAFGTTGPSGSTVVDGKLSRQSIAAIAYDESGRLLDIDTNKAQVVLQDPKTGKLTDLSKPGAFPAISTTSNGFDIVGSDSFAVVNLNHAHTLFAVNPKTGSATKIGAFPDHVIDLALKW